MKIVLLSAASSVHTIQWANGLSKAGHDVYLISQHRPLPGIDKGIRLHILPHRGAVGYYLNTFSLKRLLKKIQPDILNAHYASGYGTTARLTGFHPYVLSVWGSDVYDFPGKSWFHSELIQKNLRSADHIASTSICMAEQTRTIMRENAEIAITPFGVELDKFSQKESGKREQITIGTVKTLAPNYGIDTLIEAFALVRPKLRECSIETDLILKIVGEGPQRGELENLVARLNLSDCVHLTGAVAHAEVPGTLQQFDIFVALSRRESFGVAVIEAGAASLPVVVSDVGGLPEVTIDGVTGFVVKKDDPQDAADKLVSLCKNHELREQMGKAGYQHVSDHYDWSVCLENMVNVYKNAIKRAQI